METKATMKTGTPIQMRAARITERLARIDFCLDRDKGVKHKVEALEEEKEMLGMELKVAEYKASKGA